MNDKQLKNWSTIRIKGKTNYILKVGILGFGLIASSIASLILHFWSPVEHWYIRPLFNLILFCIVGYFMSKQSWKKNEKEYSKHSQ